MTFGAHDMVQTRWNVVGAINVIVPFHRDIARGLISIIGGRYRGERLGTPVNDEWGGSQRERYNTGL